MEYENKYKYHTKYFYSGLQINFALNMSCEYKYLYSNTFFAYFQDVLQ